MRHFAALLFLLLLISCAGAARVVDSVHELGSEAVLDERGLARPPRQASGKRQGGFTGPEGWGSRHGRGAGDSHPRVETALSGFDPLGAFGWLPCPPSKRSAHCPDCDRIHSEMCDLKAFWNVFRGLPSDSLSGYSAVLPNSWSDPYGPTPFGRSAVLGSLWYSVASISVGYLPVYYGPFKVGNFFGCDIFVEGNGTKSTFQYPVQSPNPSCFDVPFRSLAHTITAYALNGSDMFLNWTLDDPRGPDCKPYNPSGRINVKVNIPNRWLVSQAAQLNWAINLLPADILAALQLGDEWDVGLEYTRNPSIGEVFTKIYEAKTMEYINATSKSWPWTPPLPPPPPTPPPCPGGSLKACIGLCPDTPMDAQKACIQECMDVCNHKLS